MKRDKSCKQLFIQERQRGCQRCDFYKLPENMPIKKKELRRTINRFALKIGRLKKEKEETDQKEEGQWKTAKT